jgi:hypothetical protein
MQTRTLAIAGAVVGAGLILVAGILIWAWPFTQAAVERDLGHTLSGRVQIGTIHSRWFPHPGCTAENVHIESPRGRALIRKLIIESSYAALLRRSHSLASIRVQGLSAQLRRGGGSGGGSGMKVGEMAFDDSEVEFEPTHPGGDPLKIGITHADFRPASLSRPMAFNLILNYPKPRGKLEVHGSFEPDPPAQLSAAKISGTFRFDHAELGVFHGLRGVLASHGKFSGPLERVTVDGSSEVAGFKVGDDEHHPVHLAATFRAIVNGTNGDTHLESIETELLRSRMHWDGDVAQSGTAGKEARLELASQEVRIQDLLFLVTKSPRPAMNGAISFRANVVLPPGQGRFLEKVRLDGDFRGSGAQFGNPKTQANVTTLSERARGDTKSDENPDTIIANLKGHVSIRDAVAHLSNLTFAVPGAFARLDGTFNLITHAVNLHGSLAVDKELSQTTTGFKSLLLKAVDPFFKRKRAGAVIPVTISGTYEHAVFSSMGMRAGNKRSAP